MHDYCHTIQKHYASSWGETFTEKQVRTGRYQELPAEFRILEFPPTDDRGMWSYGTVAMSQPLDPKRLELHMFSRVQSDAVAELLYIVAHYHRTGSCLGLSHTVNFGRGWMSESIASYGLISLPYLDGPGLKHLGLPDGSSIRFLWLLPITQAEREFAKSEGVEALESRFEDSEFDYLDPGRESVV